MSMQGIDVSGYQSGIDLAKVPADFIIVKATEGTGYLNPDCVRQVSQALQAGRKVGVYHYCNGVGASEEARYFYDACKQWHGKVVWCLDWESGGNAAWGDTAYLDRCVKTLAGLTGKPPVLYASASAYPWNIAAANNCGTWVAQYAGMNPTGYQNTPWNEGAYSCTIRQYASTGRLDHWSGNLDLNKFYGSPTDWDQYIAGRTPAKEENMSTQVDVWNYGIGSEGRSGYKNVAAWQRLSYIHWDTARLFKLLSRTDDAGTKDGSKGDIYTRIVYIDKRVRELSATVTAQAAAIEALSKALGDNPQDIAAIVQQAVKNKLEQLDITITTQNKEE